MKKADNMHETADLPEQNLPVGSASAAKSSRSESLDTAAAIGGAVGREPASPGIASESVSATTTDPSIIRSIERAHDLMSLHALRLRDCGADSLHVVIKPGSGLRLSLNLQMRGGSVAIQARLNHGDFDFLSRHWNELQQQFAARGIRLASLEQGEPTLGSTPDDCRNANLRPGQGDARSAEAFAGLASTRSLVIPPAPSRAEIPRGQESWP
jgi:hypothetical protein